MIHIISATIVNLSGNHGENIQLAMCGEPLGSYADAVDAGHKVGNYTQPEKLRRTVTCIGCLNTIGA